MKITSIHIAIYYILKAKILSISKYLHMRSVKNKVAHLGMNCSIGNGIIINGKPNNHEGISIGDNVTIYDGFKLIADYFIPEAGIKLGNNIAINYGAYIGGDGGVSIGNDVLMGPEVCILSGGHRYANPDIPIIKQPFSFGKIIIEDDVWIGARAIILQGVTIGHGSVIWAGSVVVEDIPPYSIAVGNPAKVIKKRKASDT